MIRAAKPQDAAHRLMLEAIAFGWTERSTSVDYVVGQMVQSGYSQQTARRCAAEAWTASQPGRGA